MTRRFRTISAITLLTVLGVAVAAWAVQEGNRQREETAAALAVEATLLARSLGPALAAAAGAAREIDDMLARRLLDNARLLSALHENGVLSEERASWFTEENELDSVVHIERNGSARLLGGAPVPEETLSEVHHIISGGAEELFLESDPESGDLHFTAAVRVHGGGVLVIRIHGSSARSFAREVGIDNLLESMIGTGGVLYLSYLELPSEIRHVASWDDGPVPSLEENRPDRFVLRDRSILETVVPVRAPAGIEAALRIGLDAAPLDRASAAAMRRTVLVGSVLAGLALALAGITVVLRSRALEREEAARRLADAEHARRSSERLAAAGSLTAGLAHEVRSPLNAIGLAAQRIERKHSEDDDCFGFARRIHLEVCRLEGTLRDFLELAAPSGHRREETEIGELANGVIDLLRVESAENDVILEPCSGAATAMIDREAVRRSIMNLVRNAINASPADSRVRTTVEKDGGDAVIRIRDDGAGITPAEMERVFDPFHTTSASGTGLGLSLVRRVAEDHGGTCRLTNVDGGGLEAELRLPGCGPDGRGR